MEVIRLESPITVLMVTETNITIEKAVDSGISLGILLQSHITKQTVLASSINLEEG